MQVRALVGALLLVGSPIVLAADAAGEFAMKGAGFLPCEAFVKERESRSDIYYLIAGWTEGYITAHNRLSRDTYDITSFESIELLLTVIQNHCASYPRDRLYTVLNSILIKLEPDRLSQDSPAVEIAEGERRTTLYRETIRRLQARLAQLGLYHDPVDGVYTDATRSAILAFQSDIGFEMTGFPDQSTLWRLFRD